MLATPLVASVAFRTTVTLEMNQPLAPDCPERATTELGGAVSTEIAMEHRLRESREIRRKIFDEMLAVGEDERAGVGGPVSSVDPVGDAIDAAQGVRGAQGYGHIGDEPSIRSRRPGDRGGRGGRSHVDVHHLRPDRF